MSLIRFLEIPDVNIVHRVMHQEFFGAPLGTRTPSQPVMSR